VTGSAKPTDNAGVALPSELSEPNTAVSPHDSASGEPARYPVSATTGAEVPESVIPTDAVRHEFSFPGVLAAVPECRDQVMEFVTQHCPDEGEQIDLLVAVQEALANAALHGCKDDPSKTVHCEVTASPEEIVISVRDPGPGFDVTQADPENYKVTQLTHGRGICLIRSLVTDVAFAHHGAEIVMHKRITRGAS
jgi:serine/threonine-protein kinase RsbW